MAPPKTTLIAVRHGETEWNAQQRFQGQGDSRLTQKGRRDVDCLGKRLRQFEIDRLISSDLGRAVETARLIAGHTGHKILKDPRLRERHYGVLEGLNIPEIEIRHTEVLQALKTGDPDYVVPGGESRRQLFERNESFISQLVREHAGTTTLVVVHGGVLESILRLVCGMPLDHPRCFTPVNAALNIFSHGPYFWTTRWVVETWGDAAHLYCPASRGTDR